jgi:hypothetical protein
MVTNHSKTLYCVGCGRALVKSEGNKVLAISCSCGALAPILHAGEATPVDLVGKSPAEKVLFYWLLKGWCLPVSLVAASRGNGPMPHLEYYLGFSEHQTSIKAEMVNLLRELGAVSFTECSDANCRESFKRARQRHLLHERRQHHE